MKSIERLHTQGNAFISYPFRIVYLHISDKNEAFPIRTMVSVSKKKFKTAVDRNRVKRLMREAYRLNKSNLIETAIKNNLQFYIAFQYISEEILAFSDFNQKMQKTLNKLLYIISEKAKSSDENG